VRELQALRVSAKPAVVVDAGSLPPAADIELEVRRGTPGGAGVRLTSAVGEQVTIGVAGEPPELFVDRRRSRATPFHEAYPGRHAGPVRWREDRVTLRILFDRTTLEVFANDGETVISERVYPTRPFERLEVVTGRGVIAGGVAVWELRSVWERP
jgi:sucrose-6-phosphate hydrolase SacC (GH32 family)